MKRYCFRRDNHINYYLVDSRRLCDFEQWLKWINRQDPNDEKFTDFFPIGNRESLEPPSYAMKVDSSCYSFSFSDPKLFTPCGKKLECGSNCVDELGHDGDCLCVGDEDGESGTCPA